MAVHLTKIYTRTGDDGTSGLGDFSRVVKTDPRLVAYADAEEANAAIGVATLTSPPAVAQPVPAQHQQVLPDFDALVDKAGEFKFTWYDDDGAVYEDTKSIEIA
jgi:cob(I)alamin adenosyltransferase